MKGLFLLLLSGAVALGAMAEVQVINGRKYECRDGLCQLIEEGEAVQKTEGTTAAFRQPRIAQGYMTADRLVAFIEGRSEDSLAEVGMWAAFLLALLGGLCMNLTPCVLPMMPVNLMIVGRSARRGAAYGLGIALAYGSLGLLAALGGVAFGTIQGSPWFNAAVAVVFVGLALALFDVWFVDFSRFRPVVKAAPFLMGALSAVLAGACVAPVLVSVLLLTADQVSKGRVFAALLPFAMGVGMALPWPFAGAGLRVLPKPGRWMRYVNRAFGLVVIGFAFHYGSLAVRGWRGEAEETDGRGNAVSVSELPQVLARARRPVFVECGASWCKNCAAMERRVLPEESVKRALAPFTVLRVQAEDLTELRKTRGFESVRGLPAFVIFD